MNRDPELRQKKQASLNKRYTLRRIGELDDDPGSHIPGGQLLLNITDTIEQRLGALSVQVERLCQINSVDKSDVEETRVGDTIPLSQLTLSVSQPNPRSVIVVVKDKGNTERVFKALKRSFPGLTVSIMDRERVEVKQPRITEELRVSRGHDVDRSIQEMRKSLKKLELQTYDQIKKSSFSSTDATALRTHVRDKFASAEEALIAIEKDALDELGLE